MTNLQLKKTKTRGRICHRASLFVAATWLVQAPMAQAVDPVLSPADEPQPEELDAVHEDEPQSLLSEFDQTLTLGYSHSRRFYRTSDSRYMERHGFSLFHQKSLGFTTDRIAASVFQTSLAYQRILESPISRDRVFPSFLGVRMTLASDHDFTRSLAAFSLRYYLPLDADERKYDEYIGAPAAAFHYQYRVNNGLFSGTTLGYNVELKRSFRRYRTSRGGSQLEQISLTNSLDVTVPIRPVSGLNMRASALRADRWDYDNDRYPLDYVISYGLNYAVNPNLALSASAVQGDQLFSLGGDPNLAILDENQTYFVFGLSYSMRK